MAAARAPSCVAAARGYWGLGWSVLPLKGKVPAVRWKPLQQQRASKSQLRAWKKRFNNVGIICGAVSGNLVVIDFDQPQAYQVFCAAFPDLAQTYTVKTGSGKGYHVYLIVHNLPQTQVALKDGRGFIEIRAEGCLVAAPPSVHGQTKRPYTIFKQEPVLSVEHVKRLEHWVGRLSEPAQKKSPARASRRVTGELNPKVVEAIITVLEGRGYQWHGDWLNGSCPFRHNHRRGDRRASFGYHAHNGYGYCFTERRSYTTKEIAEVLGIDPGAYGGLMKASSSILVTHEPHPSMRLVSIQQKGPILTKQKKKKAARELTVTVNLKDSGQRDDDNRPIFEMAVVATRKDLQAGYSGVFETTQPQEDWNTILPAINEHFVRVEIQGGVKVPTQRLQDLDAVDVQGEEAYEVYEFVPTSGVGENEATQAEPQFKLL